jgi:L-lysine 2,3-aminomutase
VIDAPGGGGKVPVNPDYVERITEDEIVFRNYEGHVFSYPLKSTPKLNDALVNDDKPFEKIQVY